MGHTGNNRRSWRGCKETQSLVHKTQKALCLLRSLIGKDRMQLIRINNHSKQISTFNKRADVVAKDTAKGVTNIDGEHIFEIHDDVAKQEVNDDKQSQT